MQGHYVSDTRESVIKQPNSGSKNELITAFLADEKYDQIENHGDEATRIKIANFEYVDLARLIPKDRVMLQQDNCMVQVNRNGQSFYELASIHESGNISSFSKWELAFRIYSTILVVSDPNKAKELKQYSHTIYTASLMG